MKAMSKKEYKDKLKIINAHNEQVKMKRSLRSARFNNMPKFKKPNTSKLLVFIVLLINLQIIWYVEYVIDKWGDLSALYALIGVPVTLVPTLLGYMHKSQIENTADSGYVYEARVAELQSLNSCQEYDNNTCGNEELTEETTGVDNAVG